MQIRFDHGPGGEACSFERPLRMISAQAPHEVPGALAALDAARDAGVLDRRVCQLRDGPCARAPPGPADALRAPPSADALWCLCKAWCGLAFARRGLGRFGEITPAWDAARYAAAFRSVHDYISAGDIYQANLTFPLHMQAEGGAEALYAMLCKAQPVRHGALILQAGLPDILSRSPELFFRTDAAGRIETRPMKGTQPRGDTRTRMPNGARSWRRTRRTAPKT